MDLPGLRHFHNGYIYSDPVEALVGEAWVTAVLCHAPNGDVHWATPDMATLTPVTEWRYGQENERSPEKGGQGNERVQSRNAQKRQTRTRQGTKGQKP